MSGIDWSKSYVLTAEQVAILGLEGISVNDKQEDDDGDSTLHLQT